MSDTVKQFAGKLIAVSVAIPKGERLALNAICLDMKTAYGAKLGKFRRMRNVGRKGGVNVRASYRIAPRGDGMLQAFIAAVPPGPAAIAERGAGAHRISPRRGRKALKIGEGFAPAVDHPGMSGGGAWGTARRITEATSLTTWTKVHRRVITDAFK